MKPDLTIEEAAIAWFYGRISDRTLECAVREELLRRQREPQKREPVQYETTAEFNARLAAKPGARR